MVASLPINLMAKESMILRKSLKVSLLSICMESI